MLCVVPPPSPWKVLATGLLVVITACSGPRDIPRAIVPSVVGMAESDAAHTLRTAGFSAGVNLDGATSRDGTGARVVRAQQPQPGFRHFHGSQVDLSVVCSDDDAISSRWIAWLARLGGREIGQDEKIGDRTGILELLLPIAAQEFRRRNAQAPVLPVF